jgi:hypothetical protein
MRHPRLLRHLTHAHAWLCHKRQLALLLLLLPERLLLLPLLPERLLLLPLLVLLLCPGCLQVGPGAQVPQPPLWGAGHHLAPTPHHPAQ